MSVAAITLAVQESHPRVWAARNADVEWDNRLQAIEVFLNRRNVQMENIWQGREAGNCSRLTEWRLRKSCVIKPTHFQFQENSAKSDVIFTILLIKVIICLYLMTSVKIWCVTPRGRKKRYVERNEHLKVSEEKQLMCDCRNWFGTFCPVRHFSLKKATGGN